MEIQKARLVYFSPTQTTKRILESIAEGIGVIAVERVDVTLPETAREGFMKMKGDEVLIIGAPVYAGRLPEKAVQRFQGLKSNGNPAVVVVLYGNREIEDALLELHDLAKEAGFIPVAGGAFIGEHSFSSASIPLAEGRPDQADIHVARQFGKSIGIYLRSIRSLQDVGALKVPGSRPFREHIVHPKVSPETDKDRCAACEACASVCPTNSISIEETAKTDAETCILCCACVRECPEGARALKDPLIGMIIEWLKANTVQRKEPEVFIAGI